MLDTKRLLLIFFGMWAATYLPRYLPLAYFSRVRLPAPVLAWLSYLPAAMLAALLFPGSLSGGVAFSNPSVWALGASFAVALATRNLVLTVLAGSLTVLLFGL